MTSLLSKCDKLKEKGNALFKSGKINDALTGLQVWSARADHFSIGQLLATVPLWEINLRSKVAVF